MQKTAFASSQKRTSDLSECRDLNANDLVRPGRDSNYLSSFKLHGDVDVRTSDEGKLDVIGSSPANPVCIGSRFQEDDSAKVSLAAKFDAVESAIQTQTFPGKDDSLFNDDIEGEVRILGEPPRNGSRKRQLRKAVDRVFDDCETSYKPIVGVTSASTAMKIEGENGLDCKNSAPLMQGPSVSDCKGKKRTRKNVVRDVKNSTETSESKGTDDICQEEKEFATFADRDPTQSPAALNLNITAALNALEEVASKGQILHVEKVHARYVTKNVLPFYDALIAIVEN